MLVKQWEDVETPYGREHLLRIETRVSTPQGAFDTLLWCDKKGEIRSYSQSTMTAHRTVKSLALAENEVVDLYDALNIKITNAIPQPHRTRRAIYQARLRNGADPLQVFPSDHSQRVTLLDKDRVQIEVVAVRPEIAPLEETPQSPPEAADLAPNALIQSDDSRIKQLLPQIQGAAEDPWQWALSCEAFVAQAIENKQLTEAFLTAAEVADSRTGDCTEHAVLTAALCRAHGMPARVATGLVAYQDIFAFHMWNEVWIGDRWMPIDATLGLGGIGAGHIKLGVSNLEGVSPFAALSPVLEVMGALDLEVISWE
jgi:transglutaminase-like putative cysteine protease